MLNKICRNYFFNIKLLIYSIAKIDYLFSYIKITFTRFFTLAVFATSILSYHVNATPCSICDYKKVDPIKDSQLVTGKQLYLCCDCLQINQDQNTRTLTTNIATTTIMPILFAVIGYFTCDQLEMAPELGIFSGAILGITPLIIKFYPYASNPEFIKNDALKALIPNKAQKTNIVECTFKKRENLHDQIMQKMATPSADHTLDSHPTPRKVGLAMVMAWQHDKNKLTKKEYERCLDKMLVITEKPNQTLMLEEHPPLNCSDNSKQHSKEIRTDDLKKIRSSELVTEALNKLYPGDRITVDLGYIQFAISRLENSNKKYYKFYTPRIHLTQTLTMTEEEAIKFAKELCMPSRSARHTHIQKKKKH